MPAGGAQVEVLKAGSPAFGGEEVETVGGWRGGGAAEGGLVDRAGVEREAAGAVEGRAQRDDGRDGRGQRGQQRSDEAGLQLGEAAEDREMDGLV